MFQNAQQLSAPSLLQSKPYHLRRLGSTSPQDSHYPFVRLDAMQPAEVKQDGVPISLVYTQVYTLRRMP